MRLMYLFQMLDKILNNINQRLADNKICNRLYLNRRDFYYLLTELATQDQFNGYYYDGNKQINFGGIKIIASHQQDVYRWR